MVAWKGSAFALPWMCSAKVHTQPAQVTYRPAGQSVSRWDGLTLHFVSLKVPVERSAAGPAALRMFIERKLSAEGCPVRWAVVKADAVELTVDAVVSGLPGSIDEAALYADDSEGRFSGATM